MAAKGELRPTDHVWCEALSDWVPASKVKGLFSSSTARIKSRSQTAESKISKPVSQDLVIEAASDCASSDPGQDNPEGAQLSRPATNETRQDEVTISPDVAGATAAAGAKIPLDENVAFAPIQRDEQTVPSAPPSDENAENTTWFRQVAINFKKLSPDEQKNAMGAMGCLVIIGLVFISAIGASVFSLIFDDNEAGVTFIESIEGRWTDGSGNIFRYHISGDGVVYEEVWSQGRKYDYEGRLMDREYQIDRVEGNTLHLLYIWKGRPVWEQYIKKIDDRTIEVDMHWMTDGKRLTRIGLE